MKLIFLIVFLPLIDGFRVSFSCFFLGKRGCEIKCSLKCLLLDCVYEQVQCEGWSRCVCNEVYNTGDGQLTNVDFENSEFVELWNTIFETSTASTNVRRRIQKRKQIEAFVFELLRNPYMTGKDIISRLKENYPNWKDVDSLRSRQRGLKTQITEAGKTMQYTDLESHFEELLELINNVPNERVENAKYRRRLKRFLKKITDPEDLEEILNLTKLSSNAELYAMVKSFLKEDGYGFEEDGDNVAQGKKAILKSTILDVDDANEDEMLDLAVAKNILSKSSPTDSVATAAKVEVATATATAAATAAATTAATTATTTSESLRDTPYLDELLRIMDTIPPEDVDNPKHQRRLRQFFSKLTNVADVEQALFLIRLSNDENLYVSVKSLLRRQGYGFEEDGDRPSEHKVIIKPIRIDVNEGNEHGTTAVTGSSAGGVVANAASRQIYAEDGANMQIATPSAGSTSNSVSYGYASTTPPYANPWTSQPGTNEGTLYYMVVDENGKVVQATGVPKKPITFMAMENLM